MPEVPLESGVVMSGGSPPTINQSWPRSKLSRGVLLITEMDQHKARLTRVFHNCLRLAFDILIIITWEHMNDRRIYIYIFIGRYPHRLRGGEADSR